MLDECLADAQAKGYAEAEPSPDIDGFDTAHKAVILASLAYGGTVPMDAVHVEGIRGLSDLDIGYAQDLGYRVKLLAVIKESDGAVEIRVDLLEILNPAGQGLLMPASPCHKLSFCGIRQS